MMTEQYINLEYMDLICGGDIEMKQTMIAMLLEEIPEDLNNLNFFHDSQDWENLGNLSHKLKTTFAYLGHDETAECNKQIERITRYNEGDYSELRGLLDAINRNMDGLMVELKAVFDKIS